MKVYVIGAGMGGAGSLTCEGKKAIDECELLIGSARIMEGYKDREILILSMKTEEVIRELSVCGKAVAGVLYSGDGAFYSSAVNLYKELSEQGYEALLIPGVSSMSYFCNAAGIPYGGAKIVSAHGREVNLLAHIRDEKRLFALLGGPGDIIGLCDKLFYYGMDGVKLWAGVNLSYPDEYIQCLDIDSFKDENVRNRLLQYGRSPAVIFAENEKSRDALFDVMEDEDFIRASASKGVIPMTKQAVRTMVLERLKLKKDSVLYDVGAGSGSISVAASLMWADIRVFAIEQETEACVLLGENRRKFLADNMEIVSGRAPAAFAGLRKPTHAFIGGSDGDIKEILGNLFELNPDIRVVMTVISLTSLWALLSYIDGCRSLRAQVTLLQVSNEKKTGNHRLMMALNPVYVVLINGCSHNME